MARTKRDLEGEIVRLSTIVDQLKGRMDGIESGSSNGHDGNQPSSRRDLLKMAGAAVAGAAGGLLNGVPAAATDGGNVVLGNTSGATLNDAAHTTSLTATTSATAAGPTPLVEIIGPTASVTQPPPNGPDLQGALQVFARSGNPAGPNNVPPARPSEGINGWAPGGIGVGVLGASDVGYGLLGESNSGLDIAAFGTGRIFQFSLTDNLGNPLAGPPSFTPAQPPNLSGGEFMRDMNSVLWVSNATGANALGWRRVNTTRVDSADGSTFFQPARIIDTRNGTGGITGKQAADTMQEWPTVFPGTNGIPANAIGIVGNLTLTGYSANGFAAIMPGGVAYDPNSSPSSINITAGTVALANSFTIGFGVGAHAGKIQVYVGHITTHVIVDVTAYIQ